MISDVPLKLRNRRNDYYKKRTNKLLVSRTRQLLFRARVYHPSPTHTHTNTPPPIVQTLNNDSFFSNVRVTVYYIHVPRTFPIDYPETENIYSFQQRRELA